MARAPPRKKHYQREAKRALERAQAKAKREAKEKKERELAKARIVSYAPGRKGDFTGEYQCIRECKQKCKEEHSIREEGYSVQTGHKIFSEPLPDGTRRYFRLNYTTGKNGKRARHRIAVDRSAITLTPYIPDVERRRKRDESNRRKGNVKRRNPEGPSRRARVVARKVTNQEVLDHVHRALKKDRNLTDAVLYEKVSKELGLEPGQRKKQISNMARRYRRENKKTA